MLRANFAFAEVIQKAGSETVPPFFIFETNDCPKSGVGDNSVDMAKKAEDNLPEIKNRKAAFEYFLIDTYTAGIKLTGTEVKSVRAGKVTMSDAYCFLDKGELWIRNLHISHYTQGSYNNHEPKRERKLLLQKREIRRIEAKFNNKGLTIIPVRIFFNDRGLVKIDIALARGKKFFDKRHTLKSKEQKREVARELKAYK